MKNLTEFVSRHIGDDVTRLVLDRTRWPEIDMDLAVSCIESRRKLKGKVQEWYDEPELIFPRILSMLAFLVGGVNNVVGYSAFTVTHPKSIAELKTKLKNLFLFIKLLSFYFILSYYYNLSVSYNSFAHFVAF